MLQPLKLNLKKHPLLRVFFCLMILFNESLYADEVNVAVASNFAYTLKTLSADFKKQSGHDLRISVASTGKLYTQILHGAPFDVFLAADETRPDLLLNDNTAEHSSAYVYASGQLVLLSNIVSAGSCQSVLSSQHLKRLSIANPKTAPYGLAAKQVLEKLSLWLELKPRLVMGENIVQALQFVITENAQAGFVARSTLKMAEKVPAGCVWDVPSELYSPIRQKMVVLTRAKDKPAVQAFQRYMQSPRAKSIIKKSGYDVTL